MLRKRWLVNSLSNI